MMDAARAASRSAMMSGVIRVRRGKVLRVLGRRPGAVELAVEVEDDEAARGPEGREARAIAYPALTGPIGPGDRVVLNTTAVAMGLGSGGWHFVMALEDPSDADPPGVDPEPSGPLLKL